MSADSHSPFQDQLLNEVDNLSNLISKEKSKIRESIAKIKFLEDRYALAWRHLQLGKHNNNSKGNNYNRRHCCSNGRKRAFLPSFFRIGNNKNKNNNPGNLARRERQPQDVFFSNTSCVSSEITTATAPNNNMPINTDLRSVSTNTNYQRNDRHTKEEEKNEIEPIHTAEAEYSLLLTPFVAADEEDIVLGENDTSKDDDNYDNNNNNVPCIANDGNNNIISATTTTENATVPFFTEEEGIQEAIKSMSHKQLLHFQKRLQGQRMDHLASTAEARVHTKLLREATLVMNQTRVLMEEVIAIRRQEEEPLRQAREQRDDSSVASNLSGATAPAAALDNNNNLTGMAEW
eukprot:CAMPEP_0118725930 /NCGR_PEP_ID=MMETSP0800-20121206/33413_1 /TAXON_ID=210618 ORGANISM="Striatella unipunctata, Strain CCMP2910" /NCGR_SAMPLE_ID=MMETSP0800 /ASSEMBLY_ACC=CAM_ASM_000638 /LENGTH=346 /DNA_ID=CAMNT_0006634683 /DNA_START=222 /DNA_END=1259 /DNA_ORIENTATION=+